MKTARRKKKKQAHAWITKFVVFSHIMSESEEVWSDVRPKAVGKKRPCSIDELCSESSEPSSTFDAMTARWCEAFETRAAACASSSWRLSSDWSGVSSGGPTYKKEIHRPLDPNVEEWVFAVSAVTQETPVMLKAGLLTAPKFAMPMSASGRRVKSSCSSKRAMACTARALPFPSNGRTGEFLPEQEAGAVALASRAQTMSREV